MSLPSGYKRLKYIESTGTQYIDTGIKNKSSLSITCDVIMNETAGNYLFGGKENIPKGIACWNSTAGFRAYFNDSTSPAIPVFQPGSSVSVSMTNGETTVNGTIHTYTPVADFELSSNLMLFAGEDHAYPSKIYMKSFTIKDGTTLVRKFIPVQRRSDNVVGMYDDCNTGKNLFNTSSVTWETGKLLEPSTGAISSNTNYKVSGFIPVTFSAGAYTVSFLKTEMVGTGTANTICFYDSNNNYVSGFGYTAGYQTYAYNTYSITVPDNAAYYKYCQRNTDVQVQLEEGNTATAYEPYDGFYTNLGTGSFVAGPVYGTVYPLVQKKVKIPNRLPKEYTELEYLQSSGTQWIDTGLHITTNYAKVKAKITPLDWNGSNPNRRGWGVQGSSDACFTSWDNSVSGSGGTHPDGWLALGNSWYFNKTSSTFFNTTLGQPHEMDFTANDGTAVGSYAGESFNASYGGTLINTSRSIYLFDCNAHYVHTPTSSMVYYFKIETAEGSRNFIPAKRNSDSVLGMYDTVSETFYTNAGTGTFIAGPRANLPDAYQELEYIQSSGTQYIDTRIAGTVDTSFELIYSQTSIGNVFGYRDAAASNNISYWTGNPDIFYVDFNNSDYDKYRLQLNDVSSYFNKKLKVESSKSLRKITNLDTSTVLGQNVVLNSDNITTGNLYLLNMNGVPYIPDLPSAKIYSCKMWQGSTLVRNLVPARYSDGVLGMYDLANSVKNLFNPIELGDIISSDGHIDYDCHARVLSDYIPASVGDVFKCSGDIYVLNASNTANFIMAEYDANKAFISGTRRVINNGDIVISNDNAAYFRAEAYYQSGIYSEYASLTLSKLQCEKGSTATAYEPYPFYTNAGTGTFTAGPSVVNTITTNKKYFVHTNIPFAYTPLTYIENTGTAYIDLGFIPNQTTSCAVHFQYNGPSTNVYDVLFGSRIAHKIRQFAAWSRSDSSGESVRIDYANGENIYGWSMNSGNKIVLVKGNDYHYEMGHTYFKLPEFNINHTFPDTIDCQGDFTCPGNLYLFAMHQCASDTDPGSATWNAFAKVYSVKINHNGSVIRDMIPAKRKSDNALGMYDKITDSFFASQGTGMVAGTELANYTLYPITQSRYFYGG